MIKIFDIEISQKEDILIENTAKGDLLVSINSSGSFCGERLKGKVLSACASITYTPAGGTNIIHEPVLLETDDGIKIFMQINAYLHLAKDMEDRIIAGEYISPDEYYYKGTVNFNVGNAGYKWLENKVFICEGTIDDWQTLRFTIYEV